MILQPMPFKSTLYQLQSYREAVKGLLCKKLVAAVQTDEALKQKHIKMRIKTFQAGQNSCRYNLMTGDLLVGGFILSFVEWDIYWTLIQDMRGETSPAHILDSHSRYEGRDFSSSYIGLSYKI